ncbi:MULTISPECIES: winged helix-turn-helix transcriptional regulator [Mycolicibacterium]|jgi:DNA-binding HxlR family transcriptional regulator|uniref:Helix-turn-helix domain-containing protein n=2 Tax=Mycolicibacterium fortuitum TaxID=1766 RepID=A0A0N9Y0M9_MYCFO|nr:MULTISPECIES: helix-turn-helix domain-containing protein [Mycolicibacterium]ALI24270.1 Transcriptional regulator, HxlR family [Mycolicibacterium fortuitum]MCA4723981.1 helix-turn-helix transcriptional regulator [Mycolicibacterium fortuitum]MCA4754231.1 helix-turn-helix transcriptional regulator [Mycolicibacterium fortuitum]MCV7139390.1 helix-turn-helix transcriptional regulator [Mycolicibacterium fortuitum]MDG5770493.1 helix-turn-helix domain-containing protein [Mycolicibacterium fortuitum]
MRTDPWSDDACPIARTMAVLGQRWAILIIREALLGRSRFSEFREQLGVASDVLSARLAELVAAGILEVEDYQEPGERTRSRYVLTDAGHDLVTVLAALGQWGRKHRATTKRSGYRFIEKSTGEHALVVFRRHDGIGVPTPDVTLIDSLSSE